MEQLSQQMIQLVHHLMVFLLIQITQFMYLIEIVVRLSFGLTIVVIQQEEYLGNYSQARGIFVSISGEIYVDNGQQDGQVYKYSLNTNSSVPVMYVGQQCYGLFIDANNILYCSVYGLHQVATKPLDSSSNIMKIVAGTQCAGSLPNQLNYPRGIFVTINFDLYVADTNNDRIQLFGSGELNGTTVAGSTSLNITITLHNPVGITLDGNNNLYIADRDNNRIVVGSGPYSFRCLVGCNESSGSAPNQMNGPRMISFDTNGNMFVADWGNNRVQKFLIVTNSCGKYLILKVCTTESPFSINYFM